MTESTLPDPVQDTPPTTRFVYAALEQAESPLSAKQLSRRTGSPTRTVQRSLNTLQELGVVVETPNSSDGRRPHYRLNRNAP